MSAMTTNKNNFSQYASELDNLIINYSFLTNEKEKLQTIREIRQLRDLLREDASAVSV